MESYWFSEAQAEKKIYYRVSIIDRQDNIQHSSIIFLSTHSDVNPYLKVLNIPGDDDLLMAYYSNKNDVLNLQLYNTSGAIVYSQKLRTTEGMNIFSVQANLIRNKGLYLIEAMNEERFSLKAKVLKF